MIRRELLSAIAAASGRMQSIFDFTAGLPAAFTMTRGGTDRLARASSGKWARYSGSAPRVHHTREGAPLGLVLERGFTDKGRLGFNFSEAPTNSSGGFFSTPTNVSLTPDPASLGQDGWGDVITSSLRFSAPSADAAWQIDTTTGNTAAHSLMGLVRDSQGTGGTTPSALSMSGNSPFGPPIYDEWALIRREAMVPTSTARISQVTCRMGHAFDLAGLWFVEAPYAPLPYWRTADNNSASALDEYAAAPISAAPAWSATGCTVIYEWWHDRPFSVAGEPLFAVHGASDYVRAAGLADGTMQVQVSVGGSLAYSATFPAPARDALHRVAVRVAPGNYGAAVDGSIAASGTSTAAVSVATISLNRHLGVSSNQFARSMSVSGVMSNVALVAASAVSGGYL